MATLKQIKKLYDDAKEYEKELIGYNDRGIVHLFRKHDGEYVGICENCGAKLKGLKHQFGHINCPKPNGEFIKNDVTPDKLRAALNEAYNDGYIDGFKCGEATTDGLNAYQDNKDDA